MKQDLTYSYRLYPNKAQQENILRVAEVARRYYNMILTEKELAFRQSGVWPQKLEVLENLEEFAQANRVMYSVLKHAAADYEKAFRHYQWVMRTKTDQYKDSAKARAVFWPEYPLTDADLKGAPNEKPAGAVRRSFSLSPFHLLFQDNAVYIPDVGWVRAVFHRLPPVDAKMVRCTVMAKSSGKFFLLVQITLEVEDKRSTEVPDEALGVVFSPGVLAVRSDGVPVPVRHSDPKLEKQIISAKKALRRKIPGSNGYAQQRQKLAKLIEKQTNRRRDAIHKASREIVNSGKYIGVQVPAVKKLAKQHKKDQVDQVVRDEAWYTFYTMIRYKGKLHEIPIYPVQRAYQLFERCATCTARLKQNHRTKKWFCPYCGDLDENSNAARNIQCLMEDEIRNWKATPQERGLN